MRAGNMAMQVQSAAEAMVRSARDQWLVLGLAMDISFIVYRAAYTQANSSHCSVAPHGVPVIIVIWWQTVSAKLRARASPGPPS